MRVRVLGLLVMGKEAEDCTAAPPQEGSSRICTAELESEKPVAVKATARSLPAATLAPAEGTFRAREKPPAPAGTNKWSKLNNG